MVYGRRVFAAACLLTIVGCAERELTNTEKGAVAGGAVGAGMGAIIGSQTGDAGAGVAIGAASGALVGGYIGHATDSIEERTAQQKEIVRRQDEEIKRQQREIEDLRRQQFYNERLKGYESRVGKSVVNPKDDAAAVPESQPRAPYSGSTESSKRY